MFKFKIGRRFIISDLWRKICVWWRINSKSMKTDIQFLQDNFLALKILDFRNWGGFCLRRVEIFELDIFKDWQKDINFI